MIFLIDSFGDIVISKHRSIGNAIKAKVRHSRAAKREKEKAPSFFWTPLAYSIKDSSGKEVCSFNS